MLSERPARLFRYDAGTDEAHVHLAPQGGDAGRIASGNPRKVDGQLLLDAQGFLVGVDLGGEGLERAVVMLGPHEKVDRTEPAEIAVHADASGEAVELVIPGANAALRAGEKNPYLP
jgi:hypothetical protein